MKEILLLSKTYLFLPGGQETVEKSSHGVDSCSDQEDSPPLLWGLTNITDHEPELRENSLTLSTTMAPVREGQRMPGMVPTVLDIPIRIAAYFGATSR